MVCPQGCNGQVTMCFVWFWRIETICFVMTCNESMMFYSNKDFSAVLLLCLSTQGVHRTLWILNINCPDWLSSKRFGSGRNMPIIHREKEKLIESLLLLLLLVKRRKRRPYIREAHVLHVRTGFRMFDSYRTTVRAKISSDVPRGIWSAPQRISCQTVAYSNAHVPY